jgi:hypothetical protein
MFFSPPHSPCTLHIIHFPVVSNLEHKAPFRVSVITHTIRHTIGLLWTSDQPVAETSTYTGQHNMQTSMPWAGFESATPATKQRQTYALNHVATGIGHLPYPSHNYLIIMADEELCHHANKNTVLGHSYQARSNDNKGGAFFSFEAPAEVPLSYITRFLCVCTEGSVLIITGLVQITYNGSIWHSIIMERETEWRYYKWLVRERVHYVRPMHQGDHH